MYDASCCTQDPQLHSHLVRPPCPPCLPTPLCACTIRAQSEGVHRGYGSHEEAGKCTRQPVAFAQQQGGQSSKASGSTHAWPPGLARCRGSCKIHNNQFDPASGFQLTDQPLGPANQTHTAAQEYKSSSGTQGRGLKGLESLNSIKEARRTQLGAREVARLQIRAQCRSPPLSPSMMSQPILVSQHNINTHPRVPAQHQHPSSCPSTTSKPILVSQHNVNTHPQALARRQCPLA